MKKQVYEIPFELWMIVLEYVDLFDLVKFGYLFVDIETTSIDIINYKNKNEYNKKFLRDIFDKTFKITIYRLSKEYISRCDCFIAQRSERFEYTFTWFYEVYEKIIKSLIVDKRNNFTIIYIPYRRSGKSMLSIILLDFFYRLGLNPILLVNWIYEKKKLIHMSQYKDNIEIISREFCYRKEGVIIISNQIENTVPPFSIFDYNCDHNCKYIWIQSHYTGRSIFKGKSKVSEPDKEFFIDKYYFENVF